MLTLISHFFNEELLLPHWLAHHLPIFDHAVLIDHASTDASCDIIRQLAPHWEVRPTRCADFNVRQVDAEVQDVEQETASFKIILNTTEFLVCSDVPALLAGIERTGQVGIWGQPMCLVDLQGAWHGSGPFLRQHHTGYQEGGFRSRLLHRGQCGRYGVGRHESGIVPHNVTGDFYVAWARFSPWPEARARKLQIQSRIPECDRRDRFGWEHIQTPASLENFYWQEAAQSYDLFARHPDYAAAVKAQIQTTQPISRLQHPGT
jgi:hypothetical protein